MYRCRGCRRRVSVTAGTIFDKTRGPLTTWFEAVWLFTSSKAGVSAATLHRVLPINSYQTAWTMLGKLRAVLSQTDLEPLTGRVEVDETFIGGVKSGKPGRGAAGKVLVAGAVEITENGWGRARMAVIDDALRISRPKTTHPTGVPANIRGRAGTLDVRTIDPPWRGPRPT